MSPDNFRPPHVLTETMPRALPLLALACLALLAPTAVHAAPRPGAPRSFEPRQLVVKLEGQGRGRTLALPRGTGVREAARALRRNPGVAYAVPNYVATASAVSPPARFRLPNDSGSVDPAVPPGGGGWAQKQWNFLPYAGTPTPRVPLSPGGIDAVGAWANLAAAGRPGGAGTTVAVLDTGVAYRAKGSRFRRSPDFARGQFVPGYDFVDRDRLPLDENGHGTHIAGTIAAWTGNGIGMTGIAYRAKLMPVRVLDRHGRGNAATIAKGIRFAVANGADVINMSFNFECRKPVPVVDEALREAHRKGVVTVASGGNLGSETCVSAPATGPHVIGVGGTTEGACPGAYSLAGAAIDLVAPGGGEPAPGCASISARPIYQVTLRPGSLRDFHVPATYVGTSMAAAHVSGAAALVLASRRFQGRPRSKALVRFVTRRLLNTARDLGLPRPRQGAGLLDAGRATLP